MSDFQYLYETYATDVYRFAYWLCGDAVDAEDITSETFLRAWTHRATIRTETMKAYLAVDCAQPVPGTSAQARLHAELTDAMPDQGPGVENAQKTAIIWCVSRKRCSKSTKWTVLPSSCASNMNCLMQKSRVCCSYRSLRSKSKSTVCVSN